MEFTDGIHRYRILSKLKLQLGIKNTKEIRIQNSNLNVTFRFYNCLLEMGNGQVRLSQEKRRSALIQPHPERNASKDTLQQMHQNKRYYIIELVDFFFSYSKS